MAIAESRDDQLRAESFAFFMKEFLMESDRAAVILGSSKIEALLGEILERYLMPPVGSTDDLLDGDSPLSTFSARTKACHRLGLIDSRLAKLLDTFRRLRNEFAHDINFGSLSVGSAKDRVAVLAESFLGHRHFKKMQVAVAAQMKRNIDESGVLFRTALAVIYVHLAFVHCEIKRISPTKCLGVVESSAKLSRPRKKNLRSER